MEDSFGAVNELTSLGDPPRGTSGPQNTLFWTISGSVAAGSTLVMSLRIERTSRDMI